MKRNIYIGICCILFSSCGGGAGGSVSPAPNPTATPVPSPTSSPTPSPSPTSSPTPSPSPSPTPSPELQNYINLLDYQAVNNPVAKQMSMLFSQATQINNITVNYYRDRNCQSWASSYSIDGLVTLNSGVYVTTSVSNLSLCSAFSYNGNNGCVYEFGDVYSMKFTVSTTNGQGVVSGTCMNNPTNFGERLAEYLTSTTSRNCTIGNSCSYSTSYSMIIN